jgi:hypothetical protein
LFMWWVTMDLPLCNCSAITWGTSWKSPCTRLGRGRRLSGSTFMISQILWLSNGSTWENIMSFCLFCLVCLRDITRFLWKMSMLIFK